MLLAGAARYAREALASASPQTGEAPACSAAYIRCGDATRWAARLARGSIVRARPDEGGPRPDRNARTRLSQISQTSGAETYSRSTANPAAALPWSGDYATTG